MPLDNYFTKPDFSRQIKQYSGTTAILSGETNILEKFSVKNIELDTNGALAGDLLVYNGTKFTPAAQGSFVNVILNGLILSYKSGLTYNVSEGSYQINNQPYTYTGGTVNIQSGDSLYSRFDVVFITTAKTPTVLSGTPSLAPVVPLISSSTQVQIGIISVPALFTGGTGSTILQVTSNTVFDYYAGGSGIQRAGVFNAQAPGEFSFAPSKNSRAYGENSIAMGLGAIASGFSQTVVGQYNDPNLTDAFIVGNGTISTPSNAFRVTTSGDTYANKKLFVTNVEVETTGASSNQALIWDGTKFKPQIQIITGLTFFSGGSNFISSITSNSLLIKALTGSTGITITDSNGLITVGLQLSGTNAVTLIQSLTGGTSIVSAKTGTTYFLYPIQGNGGTSVGLTDNKVTIYSDSISLINGANVGAGGAGVFYTKAINELQFRRLSSATPTTISINESGELLIFSADTTLDRVTTNGNVTTNSIKVSQITGTSIFLSSGFTFISGYNSYSNSSDYTRILLSDEYVTNGGGTAYGGFPGEAKTDIYQLNYFTEKITKGINPLNSGAYSAITGTTGFVAYPIRTATTITVGRESYVAITGITSGDTAIGTIFRNRFQTKAPNAANTEDNSSKNLVGTAFFNQFDSSRFNTSPVLGTLMETHLLGSQTNRRHNEVRNLQLGFFNKAWVNYNVGYNDPRAINITKSIYDLYINRPVFNAQGYNAYTNNSTYGLSANTSVGIFIESKTRISETQDDVLGRPLSTSATINYTYAPWSLFAEADRGYIGSTLVLASAQTLTSTTRGAWLDIGASQATRPHINLSAGTDPSSPQSGDLWWNGTQLYFRSGSTSVNLLSGGTGSSSTGSTTGLTTGSNLGNGVKVLFSSDTTNLGFATLSSQTPSTLRIISSSTGVILFSAVTGSGGISGTYVSGITSAGTGNINIISGTVVNNNLVYKTLSAGTNIGITESNDTIIISGSGGITGNFLSISGGTVTGLTNFTGGLSANTISGLTYYGDASNLTGVLSKTNLSTTLTVSSTTKTVPLSTFYLYDKITLSAITNTDTVTAITSNASISAYTPSIKFFAQTGITITFQNSSIIKTEGGLDAVIVGSNYDSITFTYNNDIQKYFQTNINNYI